MAGSPVLRLPRYSSGKPCPVCNNPLSSPRATFCSNACRQAAFRGRRVNSAPDLIHSSPSTPNPVPRVIVYECCQCEQRFLDSQRCPDCNLFARRLGPGAPCPHCDEPIALSDLTTSS